VDDPHSSGIAVFLFDLLEAAELESRAATRFAGIETAFQVRVPLTFEVKPDLVIELTLYRRSLDQRAQSEHQVAQHGCLPSRGLDDPRNHRRQLSPRGGLRVELCTSFARETVV